MIFFAKIRWKEKNWTRNGPKSNYRMTSSLVIENEQFHGISNNRWNFIYVSFSVNIIMFAIVHKHDLLISIKYENILPWSFTDHRNTTDLTSSLIGLKKGLSFFLTNQEEVIPRSALRNMLSFIKLLGRVKQPIWSGFRMVLLFLEWFS